MSNAGSIFASEALEPEALQLLGESYDEALKLLSSSAPLTVDEQEALAVALLGIARSGIRDAAILALKAVTAFGEKKIRAA